MSRTKNKIEVLPHIVAERIAAGEVIERPGSVVKELVENALDAGATEVAVALEEGGKNLIEIIDNGSGMTKEDLQICIQRHATSKLRKVEDLESIASLGFRGEALPSVAACSELSIISRGNEKDSACEIKTSVERPDPRVEKVTFGHFLNSPTGTRVRSQGLFSQIPARLKFLKSPRAEVAFVREWLERLALSRPEISFSLSHNDKKVFHYRSESLESRARRILANNEDYPAVHGEIESDDGSLKAQAIWFQGLSSPNTRKLIHIVNHRVLKDKLIQQAMLAPFRQLTLPGQFPTLLVDIQIDPGKLDVNIHPTKTEVRFLNSGVIFKNIALLMDQLISEKGNPSYLAGKSSESADAQDTRSDLPKKKTWRLEEPHRTATPRARSMSFHFTPEKTPAFELVSSDGNSTGHSNSDADEIPANDKTPDIFREGRLAGTLFKTYLMFEKGDELGLIDQHAAHERIRFETLRKKALSSDGDPPQQELLIPESIKIDPESLPSILKRKGLLEALGFNCEPFGESSVIFRSVPAVWGQNDLRVRLANLLERLAELEESQLPNLDDERALSLDENLFEKLASEACHSSVRAGDVLEPSEAYAIVDDLFRCENPWNCPHGRPTVVRIPRGRFEEWFQRKL